MLRESTPYRSGTDTLNCNISKPGFEEWISPFER